MNTAAPLQNAAAKPQQSSPLGHRGLLLQRQCACGSSTSSLTGECEECKSKSGLQAKLTIGASNDPLEQEADRIADQVSAASVNSAVSVAPPHIQRFVGQATEGLDAAPASVDRVLASSGRPLEPSLQQDMEQRFAHDFSRVRVYSGEVAEQSAREVSANAYTVGHNIIFGTGRFESGTQEGRRLIAHELTHVVQQSGSNGIHVGRGSEKRDRSSISAHSSPRDDAVVQRDQTDETEEERRRKATFGHLPLSPEVAASWGLPSRSPGIPKANGTIPKDGANSHTSPPGLAPKPQAHTLEDVIALANVDPHRNKRGHESVIGDEEVIKMTGIQRLSRAVDFAKQDDSLRGDVKAEIEALFTPQAIAGMAFFAGLYIAAQLTPAGWIADGIALTALTISAIFVGAVLFDIMKNLGIFISAINARTYSQLRESGHALTRAIAKAGIALVIALLTRTLKGAAKSYDGPPPPSFADAVTPDGLVIRAPAAAIEAVPQAKSPAVNLAAKVVGAPPPTGVSGKQSNETNSQEDPNAKEGKSAKSPVPVRTDGLRPTEQTMLRQARKFYNLPETPTEQDSTIVGVLIAEGRSPITLKSGTEGGPSGGLQRGGVPRGPGSGLDRYTAGHVEGHAAAIMREQGIQKAILLIEKYFCPNCDRNFPRALPKGSQVIVVSPDSAEIVNSAEL